MTVCFNEMPGKSPITTMKWKSSHSTGFAMKSSSAWVLMMSKEQFEQFNVGSNDEQGAI